MRTTSLPSRADFSSVTAAPPLYPRQGLPLDPRTPFLPARTAPSEFPSEDEPCVPRRRGDHAWHLGLFAVLCGLLTLAGLLP